MLSIPDMAILGAAALLLFGPEQLPRVARRAGNVMREIQNTSSSFIREMERAADITDPPRPSVYEPVVPYEPPAPDPLPYDVLHEPAVHDPPLDAVVPVHQPSVGEKLAEPREALDRTQALERAEGEGLPAAELPPERDHPPHV